MTRATNGPLETRRQWLALAAAKGLLEEAEIATVLTNARAQHVDAAALLLTTKRLTEDQIWTLKAEAAQIAFVDIERYAIDPAVLKRVPEWVARKHQLLPLYAVEQTLTIALTDPWDAVAIDAVRVATKCSLIHLVVSTPRAIRAAIDRYYGRQVVEEASQSTLPPSAARAAQSSQPTHPPLQALQATDEVSIIKLVDALLSEALDARASDIHLEPDGEHIRVRLRIDGVLHQTRLFPIDLHEAVTSRIKILAKLDITEHRLPQDGHIPMTLQGRAVDLRISTYPTVTGENIVIRLLDQAGGALQLHDLGFAPDMLERFGALVQQPHGLFLVTGPTGSGKTTTLYGALGQINSMTKNIMTIEDPVEYHVPVIRQTQINLKAGVTFATGLRSMLRQDPDVILIGEIRDQETAEIAIHAALTGHLVLSTLHTNDAASAVVRLLDMGVEPFLLASTLLGVLGQRLVRRICPNCQEGSRLPQELASKYPELTVMYRGRGCPRCRDTGFFGRVGIFELFVVNEPMQVQIAARCPSPTLKALATQQGMRTMRADGMWKVQQGLTTLEELERVVPPDPTSV